MTHYQSPAVSIVGRHNSGKTTLIEKLIAELVRRGLDVGSVKHHSHVGFDIDIPGKDSYRHRAAGACETVIAAPGQVARIQTVRGEVECSSIVRSMPGHDIVVVEGYRKSGLPTIEIMRAANPADAKTATVFVAYAQQGKPLGTDFVQAGKGATAQAEAHDASKPDYNDIANKLPQANTVAIVTDIPEAAAAARDLYHIPAFGLEEVAELATFLQEKFSRPKVSLVIQAGGESRRMGQSKATVPFAGRPLICRLVQRLAPAADELIITTNEPENLGFLKREFPETDIALVRDEYNERGALPGLYTALNAATYEYVAVVACDMVYASDNLVAAEYYEIQNCDADVVIPVNKNGFEPFHAMYRHSTCLPAVKAAVDGGEKRAQAFFDKVKLREFTQDRVQEVVPRGGCFINANTPQELHALEAQVLRGE